VFLTFIAFIDNYSISKRIVLTNNGSFNLQFFSNQFSQTNTLMQRCNPIQSDRRTCLLAEAFTLYFKECSETAFTP